ncbi:HAD family hydrolase [Nocardia sp. NPDC004068]|uniref:HAD family hydrolase n=1 Tax=Nocardia sp. NPDC004068 TaxID=3364303 RepID=UPI0036883E9A
MNVPTPQCLLLDFDGPVCGVFAGLPASSAAANLARTLAPPVPTEVSNFIDPFDVLRYAAEHRREELDEVERHFATIELGAIRQARPTEGAAELIRAAANRPSMCVAIVSNNSVPAINAYLDAHDLRTHITGVFARRSADVSRLKPAPALLLEALDALGCSANQTVFVGDSLTDIQAGHAANVPVIAFANRPEKAERFIAASPLGIVTSMAQLHDRLAL